MPFIMDIREHLTHQAALYINRSEVIRMIVLNLMVSTMYLRVLMDVGKQELFNML